MTIIARFRRDQVIALPPENACVTLLDREVSFPLPPRNNVHLRNRLDVIVNHHRLARRSSPLLAVKWYHRPLRHRLIPTLAARSAAGALPKLGYLIVAAAAP